MITADQVENLSFKEQMEAMELLWSKLSASDRLPSPDWHFAELAKTERDLAAGKVKKVTWAEAKKRLRSE